MPAKKKGAGRATGRGKRGFGNRGQKLSKVGRSASLNQLQKLSGLRAGARDRKSALGSKNG